nr:zinc finger, CCHC-type [Ipomoea batatas]
MSNTLFDIYQYEESSKDLWELLEAKYISEDASSKKFLVSEFNEFRMVDNRSVMEQFHEIVRILGQIRHHGMNMDDSIAIASIIDKLPPSWNKVHRALMQRKEELTMEQLGSHLYVEEGIRQKESKKKSGGSLRRTEKGKERHGLNAGCATVHTLKRTVKFVKKKCKAYLQVIMAKEVANGNKTDYSWWVDTGATRHVCKDMNLYKSYKNLEDGPSLYMGNDSMVKCVHHLYGIHVYVT